jgi:hypothetical protein
LRSRERELAMLQSVAKDRSQLLDFLHDELATLRRAVEGRAPESVEGGGTERHKGEKETADLDIATLETERLGPMRFLREFFSPLSESDLRHFHDLNRHIGELRIHCKDQLQTIERLHEQAASWRRILEADGRTQDESALRTKA